MGNDNRRGSGRQGQNNKNRGRGRGRRQQNPSNRSYESNGPDVKIRGNASTIVEKYLTLARDAQSAGDRVKAENYLQHAEHYQRIVNSFAPPPEARENKDDDDDSDDNGEDDAVETEAKSENKSEQAEEAAPAAAEAEAGEEVEAEEKPKPKPRRTRKPRVVAKKDDDAADEAPKADADDTAEKEAAVG